MRLRDGEASDAGGLCRIYDATSHKLITEINFRDDADNIRFDPVAKKVYVGFGGGGIGIGLPGLGGMGGPRQRGGMGGPDNGNGYPNGGNYPQGGNQRSDRGNSEPPTLKVRWESALPIREAELKARETNAPTVDEAHYAIAVYGVPNRTVDSGSRNLADQLKKQAALKRSGKKDVKPSSVQVLQREDGLLIVYLFPRSNEITKEDRRIGFDAQIGRLQFSQSFYVEDMTFQGKLEI